jgi:hypothetical protein
MPSDIDVLLSFLEEPLNDASGIFQRFAALPGAELRVGAEPGERFLFVSGHRHDAATLVAHADTVFFDVAGHIMDIEGDIIRSGSPDYGIGADDRAGCAILWLLRNSGHHLLITDMEECGRIGANYLIDTHPDIARVINGSSFIIQFDRRNGTDYKYYHLPVTDEFDDFIRSNLPGYHDAGTSSFTDITVLCTNVCGVNVSVGYRNEHHPEETLNIPEWRNTCERVGAMMERPLRRFPLAQGNDRLYRRHGGASP